MLWMIAPILALAGTQDAPPPFVANGTQGQGARLHIGDTGIRCVQLPCPSRAVFQPDAHGHAVRENLLYVDQDGNAPPPPMIASDVARASIVKAWEERQCIAIEGRLIAGEDDRPVLRVDDIIGNCHSE